MTSALNIASNRIIEKPSNMPNKTMCCKYKKNIVEIESSPILIILSIELEMTCRGAVEILGGAKSSALFRFCKACVNID